MDLHVYLHLAEQLAFEARLDEILTTIRTQGARMSAELETLSAKVAETVTVEQSAIALLNGLSAQIAGLKQDPAALQALADELSAKSAELASAVAANTPSA